MTQDCTRLQEAANDEARRAEEAEGGAAEARNATRAAEGRAAAAGPRAAAAEAELLSMAAAVDTAQVSPTSQHCKVTTVRQSCSR